MREPSKRTAERQAMHLRKAGYITRVRKEECAAETNHAAGDGTVAVLASVRASTPGEMGPRHAPTRAQRRGRHVQQAPLASTVGPCTETRAEHPAEAAWWSAQDMPEYYTFGDAWTATYGCFVAQGRGRTVWLDERPARWGGQWALGCSACAHFERQRASTSSEQRASTPCAKTPVPRRQSRGVRGCTKFARYEACHASMAASHARDHAQSKIHKLAVAAHLQPDRPARILRQTTGDDERLLAGSVPQPADWHGPCVLGHCSAPGRR